MGAIIAIVNQTGGVGKPPTRVTRCAGLHDAGKRVLLCDFDPQANASSGMGMDKRRVKASVYHVLTGERAVSDVLRHTPYGDLLPSSASLAGAGVELAGMERREFVLKGILEPLAAEYDYILIDCPPSLELLTVNGLCAAESILVPVQCEYFALEGLSDLMGTLRAVKAKLNPGLQIFGVLLTMFDGRTNFSLQVAQEVRRHFPGKVFSTVIPRNVRLAEAPSHGLPIQIYDRHSRGAKAYDQLVREIIDRRP